MHVGEKRKSGLENYVESIDNDPTKTALDIYMEQKICKWKVTTPFDILSGQKANSGKYMILARIACDALGIPLSTVASELAFSTGG